MKPDLLALTLVLAVGAAWCDVAIGQAPVATSVLSPATDPASTALGPGVTYERRGRRDPFEPVDVPDAGTTSATVASARLKGIVRSGTPRVLVETADGLGYILRVGDMLGEGRLIEIGVDSVVFAVPGRRGSETLRIVLRLPDD